MTIQEYRLGDLTTKIGSGATPRGGKNVYQATGVAFIRSQNVLDWAMKLTDIARLDPESAQQLDGVSVEPGDVLINITGDSIARCAVVDPSILPARVSQHVAILRPNTLIDSTYLMCALVNPQMKLRLLSESTGGTRNALTKAQLTELRIPLPPIGEQQAISLILADLARKITANNALAQTCRKLVDALFEQVVATRGDGLTPLSSLGSFVKGVSYRREDLSPGSTAMVTLKSVSREGRYAAVGLKPFTGAYRADQVIRPGEIVVAQTDLTQGADVIGRAVRVPASDEFDQLVASLDLVIGRPSAAIAPEYLLGALRQETFREHCRSHSSGTTVLHLQRGTFDSYLAPSLPSAAQGEYADQARPLLELADSAERENELLAELRDTLLAALISGRLRVEDAERQVENAI